MKIKGYLHLFSGMAMLELGNLSSTLAPFNVGVISDGFMASSQESGLVVSLELFFAAIGALFFGASNLKGQKLAFLGCFVVAVCYYLASLSLNVTEIFLIKSLSGLGCGMLIASGHSILAASKDPNRTYAIFTVFASCTGATLVYFSSIWIEEGGYVKFFTNFIFIYLALSLSFFLARKSESSAPEESNTNKRSRFYIFTCLILAVLFFEVPSSGIWALWKDLELKIWAWKFLA